MTKEEKKEPEKPVSLRATNPEIDTSEFVVNFVFKGAEEKQLQTGLKDSNCNSNRKQLGPGNLYRTIHISFVTNVLSSHRPKWKKLSQKLNLPNRQLPN